VISVPPTPSGATRTSTLPPAHPPPRIAGLAPGKRKGARWARARTLLLIATPVLAADWMWPLQGTLSYGLAAAVTVLVGAWVIAMWRADRVVATARASAAADQRGYGIGTRLFHLGALLFMMGFVFAKWVVLIQAGRDSEAFVGSSRSYSLAIAVVFAVGLIGRGLRLARFMSTVSDHPARLIALSFGVTGVLGALALSLPMSVEEMNRVSLVDNLFTSFSAVCVTGLAVNNIAATYSTVGEIVLCALIQVGGLGIMVLSAAIAVLAGQRLRVRSSAVLAEMVDATSLASLRRTVVMIFLYTLLIEGIGIAILYRQFQSYPELKQFGGSDLAGPGNIAWAAVFHAVSAFCNAGFSNVYGGMIPFAGDFIVLLTLMGLIVLGGLGFPVLDELLRAAIMKLRRKRANVLSLHTRVVLRTSAILLGIMTIAYWVLEWNQSMQPLSYPDRIVAAAFQSVSSRTAGFAVIDIGAMRPATWALTCAAMFIGASPGSTGGGVKTTTIAALFAGLRAELGMRAPHLLDRTVPQTMIRKAIGVAFLSMMIVLFAFFLLLLLEPLPPLELAFEVVSAFSTTGLSTGITPKLSVPGKLLITLLMFVGRIGPLTLALALATKSQKTLVQLPEERLAIG
jgi:trk system potassium uptake protein